MLSISTSATLGAQAPRRRARTGADLSGGLQPPVTIDVAPRFETADERDAWLNRIQAVGKGTVHEDLSLDDEWYELR